MKMPIQVAMLGVFGMLLTSAPAVVWRVEGEGRGAPAADESTAYFLSKRHEVIAVNRQDGAVRWRQRTGEPGETTEGFAVVLAGTVVAAGDYNVLAFDRSTGAFRWRFIPRDGYGPGWYVGDAAGAGSATILTGSPAGRLYAIDAERGTERWNAIISLDGETTVFGPVVRGAIGAAGYSVFTAPNQGGVVVFDVETGAVRWRRAFPEPADPTISVNFAGGPVFWERQLIVSSGDGIIRGYDVETGDVSWTIPRVTTKPGDLITSERDHRALVAARGVLVSGSATGYVVAYDLATRRERWTFNGGLAGSISLRIAGDEAAVYLPTFSGRLLALDLDTGEEIWRRGDFTEGFIWAPLIHGDRVFASASSSGFFAFPRVTRP